MGRPTLAAERTEQIFEAFVRCVARHGVAGATLEVIAKEAGLARGHMRHYVGNRDTLNKLFYERMMLRFVRRAEHLVIAAPPGEKAKAMMLDLFTPDDELDPYPQAIEAVLEAARHDATVRERVYSVYAAMEAELAQALETDHPGHPNVTYRDTAYQLLALMYGHWSLAGFGFPNDRLAGTVRRVTDIINSLAITPRAGQANS